MQLFPSVCKQQVKEDDGFPEEQVKTSIQVCSSAKASDHGEAKISTSEANHSVTAAPEEKVSSQTQSLETTDVSIAPRFLQGLEPQVPSSIDVLDLAAESNQSCKQNHGNTDPPTQGEIKLEGASSKATDALANDKVISMSSVTPPHISADADQLQPLGSSKCLIPTAVDDSHAEVSEPSAAIVKSSSPSEADRDGPATTSNDECLTVGSAPLNNADPDDMFLADDASVPDNLDIDDMFLESMKPETTLSADIRPETMLSSWSNGVEAQHAGVLLGRLAPLGLPSLMGISRPETFYSSQYKNSRTHSRPSLQEHEMKPETTRCVEHDQTGLMNALNTHARLREEGTPAALLVKTPGASLRHTQARGSSKPVDLRVQLRQRREAKRLQDENCMNAAKPLATRDSERSPRASVQQQSVDLSLDADREVSRHRSAKSDKQSKRRRGDEVRPGAHQDTDDESVMPIEFANLTHDRHSIRSRDLASASPASCEDLRFSPDDRRKGARAIEERERLKTMTDCRKGVDGRREHTSDSRALFNGEMDMEPKHLPYGMSMANSPAVGTSKRSKKSKRSKQTPFGQHSLDDMNLQLIAAFEGSEGL